MSGRYQDKVWFQRRATTQSASGALSTSYTNLQAAWAAVEWSKNDFVGGSESFRAGQDLSEEPVTLETHWHPLLDSVRAKDRALVPVGYGTLGAAMGSTVTALLLTSPNPFPPAVAGGGHRFVVRVEDEFMTVSTGHGTTSFTVSRAQFGSSASTHASGEAVTHMAAIDLESVAPSPRRDSLVCFGRRHG